MLYAFSEKEDAVALKSFAKTLQDGGKNVGAPFSEKQTFLLKSGSSGVPARSGSTCGFSDDNLMILIEEDGTLTESDQEVLVMNPWSTAIEPDAYFTASVVNKVTLVPTATDC